MALGSASAFGLVVRLDITRSAFEELISVAPEHTRRRVTSWGTNWDIYRDPVTGRAMAAEIHRNDARDSAPLRGFDTDKPVSALLQIIRLREEAHSGIRHSIAQGLGGSR